MTLLFFAVGAYLLGSIPVGLLLARMRGRDPRQVGSGNIGATNVMRAAGKELGIITLAGDIMKGFIPVTLAVRFLGDPSAVALVGLAAFLGHLFPVYLRFRGGKGVATLVGIFLAASPLALAICAAAFVLSLLKWRYVSLGSLIGTALMPPALFFTGAPPDYAMLSLAVGILVFWKHRENIRRLIAGTENRLGSAKKHSI